MNILSSEIQKIRANYRTYGGLIVLWGLGILIGINVWYNPSLLPLKHLGFRLSGLYIPGLTLYPLAVVGPVVAVLIAGESIAGERIKGTLRMILTRPIPRTRIYLGKLSLIILYSLFIVFSTLLITSFLGFFLFGGGSVVLPVDFNNISSGFFTLSIQEAILRLILAGLSVSFYILAYASIALCLSSFMSHSLASPIFTLIFTAASTVIQNLEVFKPISPFLITHHLLSWQNLMAQSIKWNTLFFSYLIVGCYFFGSFLLGIIIFNRKDETT
ncbi:MAG: ABC transporter permease subunit [Candidatus Atribacteria bacterium]|nr:ABC transporter permease subunit [Candidatus Atribacteria bacterium]